MTAMPSPLFGAGEVSLNSDGWVDATRYTQKRNIAVAVKSTRIWSRHARTKRELVVHSRISATPLL